MFMHSGNDAIMCKMFPSSVGKVALSWFHKLGPRSIREWRQLAEKFTARFLTSRKAPKTFESLSVMKQRENELITDYAKKYWETFNEVKSCSEEYVRATFKIGLNEDDILQEDNKVVTEQAKGPAKQEKLEPKIYRERKEYGQAKKVPYRKKHASDPKSFFSVTTVWKEPIYQILHRIKNRPYFKWPSRLEGDKDAK
ncbi:uncharacterized protein LOC131328622 [Rhododendron vialii]|uniref:uncharacterized protein LOC131328622 n=1 Tax=Rhododendron vialii TaxID=182163 RepID=UPI00265F8C8C|nr:uncharacterized protein LOC131328622 [Rhododendron vialii]